MAEMGPGLFKQASLVSTDSEGSPRGAPTKSVIIDELTRLGITSRATLVPFHPSVRDRNDVSVLRCSSSGLIVLSTTDHVTEKETYEDKSTFKYWGDSAQTRRESALKCYADDSRRAAMVEPLLFGNKWLDIGTGAGGILDIAASKGKRAVAVEPQSAAREAIAKDGYEVYPYISDIPKEDDGFDLVTSFHVVEHLLDPVGVLREARDRMAVGGTCVIEVPHARDFLLDFLDFDPFKNFTLWSEHLVLHTRESLKAILEDAGFVNVVVKCVQRYPVANHLHWLRNGKPGGHVKWSHLCDDTLDKAYEQMLGRIDATDTLIAYGRKM